MFVNDYFCLNYIYLQSQGGWLATPSVRKFTFEMTRKYCINNIYTRYTYCLE